jgi:hypothetical protein
VIKEGDVTGTMTSVADTNLIGLELNASIAAAATRTSGVSKNVTKRVGYIGTKRYVSVHHAADHHRRGDQRRQHPARRSRSTRRSRPDFYASSRRDRPAGWARFVVCRSLINHGV